MSKREVRLAVVASLFAGVVLGFLLAPVKRGMSIASNNYISQTRYKKMNKEGEQEEEQEC